MQLHLAITSCSSLLYRNTLQFKPVVLNMHAYHQGTREHLTAIKTKHRNSLNLKLALFLALTKILPRI
jgi:hypothetical protein